MSTQIPKKRVKIEVKKEKDELKSMSHYVDDRVELVKQIFSCLKPKTINHLAPDFLKDSSLEEIEELCLNELLGLSTKRLLSIINATECPTDTESSSDSDVHNIEEHISLEEISSESEGEKNNANKQKRTKKDRTVKTQQDKSVSVLELLELQARARAIRSQLALEPVAKIEVDSDDSTEGGIQSTDISIARSNKTKENKQPEKPQQTSREKLSNGSKPSAQTKRIKLKRNFRKQNQSEDDDDESQNTDKEETKLENKESTEKNDTAKSDVNGEKKTRSPSPDVITILPSPETLCISDSSDEDEKNDNNVKSNADKPSTSAESKSHLVTLDIQKDEGNSRPIEAQEIKNEREAKNSKSSEANVDSNKPSEIEEGEIVDNKEVTEAEAINKNVTEQSKDNEQHKQNENSNDSGIQNTVIQTNVEEATKSNSPPDTARRSSIDKSRQKLISQFSEKRNDSYDDSNQQNDDVISLVHDDLEDEFQENETSEGINSKEVKLEKINTRNKEQESAAIDQHDNDVITLHNSSDEDSTLDQFSDTKESQSWNSRWLKSNRVSKILATSRLGNRVREKIKKSKKQSEEMEEEEKSEDVPKVFQSQFEEGSVQQYAEILERTS